MNVGDLLLSRLPLDQGICLVGTQVMVRRPTREDAEALAELLRSDCVLHRAAGMSGNGPPSASDYLADLRRWEQRNSAVCLANVSRKMNRAVGMISLSHIDLTARTGGIGYWTASSCWRQGLTREAFGLVFELARSMGLTTIRATIAADNIASQRIYKRYGGVAEMGADGELAFRISLSVNAECSHSGATAMGGTSGETSGASKSGGSWWGRAHQVR